MLKLQLGGGQREFIYRKGTADEVSIVQVLKNSAFNFGRLRRGDELTKFYEKFVNAGKAPLIVDAGANIGASSLYFACSFPKARVIAIESEQSNFALLNSNTAGLPVECMQAALAGSANGIAVTDGAGDLGSRAENGNGVCLLHQTLIVTLTDILETHSADGPPFIVKLDIESSREAFEVDTQWISSVPVIIAELRDYLVPGTDKVRAFVDCIAGFNRDFIYLHDNIFRSVAKSRLDRLVRGWTSDVVCAV